MRENKQKLELTWIGKDKRTRLEPRILIEDQKKSYHAKKRVSENDIFDNKLIFGDNLLALKALESEYAGKVKCIYIDPPYNTGNAFEHYDDGLEHSIWLGLMRDRLEILRHLLKDDGMILIQIDNKELHYLKVLCDEIFGRNNYRNSIIVRKGVKNVQKQFDTVERLNAGFDTIIMYSKSSDLRIPNLFGKVDKKDMKGSWNNHWRGTDRPTMRYELLGTTPDKGQFRWSKERSYKAVENYKIFLNYLDKNKINPENQSAFDAAYQKYLDDNSVENIKNFELVRLSKTGKPEHYIPPSDKILLSENWMDLLVAGRLTDFEHEKNELLIYRILDWLTNDNDIVLDSFAGSGTTGAVAHKMGRRWIMVELGEHCHTHIIPRLKRVIDGEDVGGISKEVDWKGGGGFRYYYLAPSMLEKDKWGNWIISKEYNAGMLAEAMCKHMGFTYAPDEKHYWIHGHSTETDFIYITTAALTHEQLRVISEEVGPNRTLLICCKAFNSNPEAFNNLTIKKIPQSVLTKCEWNKDDYSLNISKLDNAEDEADDSASFEENEEV